MRRQPVAACLLVSASLMAQPWADRAALSTMASSAPFPGARSEWRGYDRYDFTVDGRNALVVIPKQTAAGKPWIWRARFFGHRPEVDLALLSKGFHLVYIDTVGMYGSPAAVAHWNAFYRYLTQKHGFSPKAVLEGMSRGGLNVYNWAAVNPDKIACIYGDAPVCDFKSWPGGKGRGRGSPEDWKALLAAYRFDSEQQALAYRKNPIDNLKPLADAGIPLLNVCGDVDDIVPYEENTGILKEQYGKLGGHIEVIVKKSVGHVHGLDDPTPIVQFILRHTRNAASMPARADEGSLPSLSAGPSTGPLFERVTISTVVRYKHNLYPSVERLSDGRLLCAFTAEDAKTTGNKPIIVGAFSEDHGRTWGAPIGLIDSRPDLDYDPNVIVVGPRVIVTSTTCPPTHQKYISTSRTIAVRSEDNGRTWSRSYEIPMGRRYTAGKINNGIVLRDGTVLFGYTWDAKLEEREKLDREGEMDGRTAVMISFDRGRTWTSGQEVKGDVSKLGDRENAVSGLDEPAIVELTDGTIYMLCRTGLETLYECRSSDGGRTWSAPKPSALTSHNAPASLCRIGGKLRGILAVWCNSPKNRWPLCAAASFDDAKTWTTPRQLSTHDGLHSSYPGCTQAADGALVAVWRQERPDGSWEIDGVRFNVEWLAASE